MTAGIFDHRNDLQCLVMFMVLRRESARIVALSNLLVQQLVFGCGHEAEFKVPLALSSIRLSFYKMGKWSEGTVCTKGSASTLSLKHMRHVYFRHKISLNSREVNSGGRCVPTPNPIAQRVVASPRRLNRGGTLEVQSTIFITLLLPWFCGSGYVLPSLWVNPLYLWACAP